MKEKYEDEADRRKYGQSLCRKSERLSILWPHLINGKRRESREAQHSASEERNLIHLINAFCQWLWLLLWPVRISAREREKLLRESLSLKRRRPLVPSLWKKPSHYASCWPLRSPLWPLCAVSRPHHPSQRREISPSLTSMKPWREEENI